MLCSVIESTVGYGSTPEEAIADLKQQLEDEAP
jgi:hypothetical protein